MESNKEYKNTNFSINRRKYKYAELRMKINSDNIKYRHLSSRKELNYYRNSIVISFICIFICILSYCSVTYAWFTSNVVNTSNRIQTGTLEIQTFIEKNKTVYDLNDYNDPIFDVEGLTIDSSSSDVVKFTIKNVGTLDFNYRLYFVVNREVEADDLSDYLDVYVDDVNEGKLSSFIDTNPIISDVLKANEMDEFNIYIKLDENAKPNMTTNFDIRLYASQLGR